MSQTQAQAEITLPSSDGAAEMEDRAYLALRAASPLWSASRPSSHWRST